MKLTEISYLIIYFSNNIKADKAQPRARAPSPEPRAPSPSPSPEPEPEPRARAPSPEPGWYFIFRPKSLTYTCILTKSLPYSAVFQPNPGKLQKSLPSAYILTKSSPYSVVFRPNPGKGHSSARAPRAAVCLKKRGEKKEKKKEKLQKSLPYAYILPKSFFRQLLFDQTLENGRNPYLTRASS